MISLFIPKLRKTYVPPDWDPSHDPLQRCVGSFKVALKYEILGQAKTFSKIFSRRWPTEYDDWCVLEEAFQDATRLYPKRVKDPKDQKTWYDPSKPPTRDPPRTH